MARRKASAYGFILFTGISVFALILVSSKNFPLIEREEKRESYVVSKVVDFIQKEGTNLDTETLQEVATAIYRVSKKSGIDYRIILALAKVESNFRIDAVSPKGARGLLQVKPSVAHKVAKDLGIKLHNRKSLHDSQKNVMIGTHILSNLIEEYHDIHYALSAYNMGETRLSDYSSQNYRTKFSNAVLKEYKRYIEVLPDP